MPVKNRPRHRLPWMGFVAVFLRLSRYVRHSISHLSAFCRRNIESECQERVAYTVTGISDWRKKLKKKISCPCHLAHGLGPSASSSGFSTGQKVTNDLQATSTRPRLLPDPFQFIIHKSSHHSTLYTVGKKKKPSQIQTYRRCSCTTTK